MNARGAASSVLLVLLVGCATPPPRELAALPAACRQAIVVRPDGALPHALLSAFERDAAGAWRSAFAPRPAVVGRAGIVAAADKREGDGGTPAGVHAIGTAFGSAAGLATGLAYRPTTARDWWIDDSASPAYNTWVTLPAGEHPAVSAEPMLRDDGLYELGCVVEWNTAPTIPGRGSAIFLHVWRAPDAPTAGCIALARDDLRRLLAWLDASGGPRLIVCPR